MPVSDVPLLPKRARPPIGKIREIFLSATVRDLGNERDAVQKALHQRQTAVFLQDCWNRSAGDVVRMCLRRLEDASGYLGIFGFRYGWVPEALNKSITELECDWALYRWENLSAPPVFFFSPEIGSVAEQALISSAEATLVADYPNDPDKRELLKERQREFIKRLRQGRNVVLFSSLPDLQVRATNAVSLWNEDILENAANSSWRCGSPEIPLHELGAIGRQPQLDALEGALLARDQRRDAPALCAVVHGPPRSGHLAFRECLARWEQWEVGHDIQPGAPPHDSYDVESLIRWALGVLAGEKGIAQTGIEALADIVISGLAREPVVLILQRVDGLSGGLTAFHRDFWVPLHDALSVRWKRNPTAQRFAMLVISHHDETVNGSFFWDGKLDDDEIDFRQLLLLPPLGKLLKQDVHDWLVRLGFRRMRAIEMAERVIGTGDPLEVYEQLQEYGVWNELVGGRA
jgi:Domain of unknown function (DUF4062)